MAWLRDNMRPALARFGDEPIGSLTVQRIATWRASVPEGKRYRSHRALRQVLQAALRWRWIEDNPAVHVKNPEPRAGEIDPFNSWEELDAIAAELDAIYGPLVVFLAGTGVRPEEAFGAEWRDVDLERRMLMVRRAFAKGRLKEYGKTAGSRRAVPLRARVVTALEALPHRRGIVFPAPGGGSDRDQQLPEPLVVAVARGRGHQAPADLRPAAHLRDVEPGGGRGHLHAGSADGHEREDDRPHLRPPGGRARTLTSASCSTRSTSARRESLDALWTRWRPAMRREVSALNDKAPQVQGFSLPLHSAPLRPPNSFHARWTDSLCVTFRDACVKSGPLSEPDSVRRTWRAGGICTGLELHAQYERAPSASADDRRTLASVSKCGSADVVVPNDRWSSQASVRPGSPETTASTKVQAAGRS